MKDLNILDRENQNFWRKWFWVIVFAVSFFSAGFIRLININSHVLYFRPYRQCDSLIKARDFYFKNNNKIDQWRKDIAKAQMANISTKEPPVTEYLVSRFYKLIGRESPWVPKAVCSFFWLTAGIFVFFTIRLFGNVYHGLVGLLFFLLTPFGIFMSRSFQPESFMVMMFTASIFFLANYVKCPSALYLFWFVIVSSLAMLSKINIFFAIIMSFIFSVISQQRLDMKKVFKMFAILIITVSPSIGYYVYLTCFSGDMSKVARSIFTPHLIFHPYFYAGWVKQIGIVVGFLPFVCGCLGVYLVQQNPFKRVLIGLFAGYVLYGFIFTFTTPTHDYYHVQLIPIIALGLPYFVMLLAKQLTVLGWIPRSLLSIAVIAVFGFGFFLLGSIKLYGPMAESKSILINIGNKCYGFHARYISRFRKDSALAIEKYKKIGSDVRHSKSVITFGNPTIQYFGEYVSHYWPEEPSIMENRNIETIEGSFYYEYSKSRSSERGGCISAPEIYDRFFKQHCPEYFVVASTNTFFLNNKSLQSWLLKYPSTRSGDYLIFNLNPEDDR